MLHIVLKDIKNMLRRPAMFIILLLGIIIASASMVMYYTMGSKKINIINNSLGQRNTVEVKGYGMSEFEIDGILELIEEGSLPDVQYIYAVDYDSENYDLLGFKSYHGEYSVKVGNFIEDGDTGQCLVTADWFDDRTVEVGEEILIRGKKYKVKGINDYFNALTYDIRRLQLGTEFVAGSDTVIERDEEVKDRPSTVAIVPLEDFSKNMFLSSIYHIVFSEPITMDQRTEIEQLFSDQLSLTEFTDISAFMETNNIVQWSESAIYLAAVLAGIVNIISLFAYFLRENKRQYAIYKLLGASNGKISSIMLIELLIYTTVGFIIGTMGALPLISTLSVFEISSLPTIGALIILFIILYISAAFICFLQIKHILNKKEVKQRRSNDERKTAKKADIQIGNRFLYLLSFQYKNRNALNFISLICLSIAVAFSFTYAMTYVFESGKFDSYYKANYDYDFGIISMSDEYASKLVKKLYMQEISYIEQDEQTIELINKLKGLEGVNNVAQISINDTIIYDKGHYKDFEGDYYSNVTQYSYDYIDSIDMPMAEGSWENMKGYDPTDETAVIPCVVKKQKAEKYPLGCEFTAIVDFDTGMKESGLDEEGLPIGVSASEPVERKFKVVGVVDEKAYVFSSSCQVYGCDRKLQDVTILMINFYNSESISTDIISPIIYHNGKKMFSINSTDLFVYGDKRMSDEMKDVINEAAAPTAEVFFFSTAIENYNKLFSEGGGDIYVFHSIISGLLLILGVGGFSLIQFSMNRRTFGVYYTCGMSWSNSIKQILTVNAFNTLLPAILGAYLGIVMASRFRYFLTSSKILSMLCGIGLVALILAIVGIITARHMKKINPKLCLRRKQNDNSKKHS